MKKSISLLLMLILVLSGCNTSAEPPETVVPAPADFSFTLPEGYSIAYVEEYCCSILRDTDCIVVGGMEVTSLSRKALTEDSSDSVLYYLQNSFHKTNNVEFVTFHVGVCNHNILRQLYCIQSHSSQLHSKPCLCCPLYKERMLDF